MNEILDKIPYPKVKYYKSLLFLYSLTQEFFVTDNFKLAKSSLFTMKLIEPVNALHNADKKINQKIFQKVNDIHF